MQATARITALVAALGVVFGTAWGVGTAVGAADAAVRQPVPIQLQAQPLVDPVPPFPTSRVDHVEGYQVRLDGTLRGDGPSAVFATVSRDGAGVTDLEPVQGAFGRLVAVRQDDLTDTTAVPHLVAPTASGRSGPAIGFTVDLPGPGHYRLLLTFQHEGRPRAVEFTVSVTGA